MSFWSVFAAAVLAQAVSGALAFLIGWIWGRMKRRRIERETRQDLAAASLEGYPKVGRAAPGSDLRNDVATVQGLAGIDQGLSPCPFCSHQEGTVVHSEPGGGDGFLGPEFHALCYTCGAMGPTRFSDDAAKLAWNGGIPRVEPETF